MHPAQKIIERSQYCAKVCASRATFLAGYSYYELGRWAFYGEGGSQQHRIVGTMYLVCVTSVFAMCVLSAAGAGLYEFYSSSLIGSHKGATRRANSRSKSSGSPGDDDADSGLFGCRLQFLKDGLWSVRWTYWMFILATLTHMMGSSLVGFNYYATSNLRWVVFGFGLSGLVFALRMFSFMAHQFIKVNPELREHRNDPDALLNAELALLRGMSAGRRTHSNNDVLRTNSGGGDVILVYPSMLSEAELFSNQAVFIGSFALAGTTRFLPNPSAWGVLFPPLMSISCVCSCTCMLLMTLLTVYLKDILTDDRREQFARAVLPLWQLLKQMFALSLYALLAGICVVGWGAKYINREHVPLMAGGAAIIVCLYGDLLVSWSHTAAAEVVPRSVTPAERRIVARLRATVEPLGSTASIFAGFSVYNALTWYTDVYKLHYSKMAATCFLVTYEYTFCFGVCVVLLSTRVSASLSSLETEAARVEFARRVKGLTRLTIGLFASALVLFMWGFGLYGGAKMKPMKFQPLIGGITGSAIAVLMVLRATFSYWTSRETPENKCVDPKRVRTSKAALGLLNVTASRALFFGGFSAFAINFLFKTDTPYANPYIVLQTISFAASMVVVLFNTAVQIMLTDLDAESRKVMFTSKIAWMCRLCYYLFNLSLFSFFGALVVMGYIKTYYAPFEAHPLRYIWPFLVGGILGLVLMVTALVWIGRAWYDVKHGSLFKADIASQSFNVGRLVSEVDAAATLAAFISGNSFYEILFSNKGKEPVTNYMYFSLTAITFIGGALVVVICTSLSAGLADLTSEKKRMQFGRRLHPASLLFFLLNLQTYSWISCLLVLAYVKYQERWPVSAVWGVVGLCYLTYMWRTLQAKWIIQYKCIQALDNDHTSSIPLLAGAYDLDPLLEAAGGGDHDHDHDHDDDYDGPESKHDPRPAEYAAPTTSFVPLSMDSTNHR